MKKLLAVLALTLPGLAVALDEAQLRQSLQRADTLLIDVRTPGEFADGAIAGAINIPYEQVGREVPQLTDDKERTIVLYCRSGRRSDIAREALLAAGYHNVIDAGGYEALKSQLR